MSFKTTGAAQHRNWNLFLGRASVPPPYARFMYFDEFGAFVPIEDYYNGGAGGDLGVSFSANIFGGVSPTATNVPSPPAIAVITDYVGVINIPAGFTYGVSFFYALGFADPNNNYATFSIYDGVDGTGALLYNETLFATGSFGDWVVATAGVTVARSIVITVLEPQGVFGFDNLALGPAP